MPTQLSLFPVGESIQAVEQEAIAMLPINTQNEVVTLIRKVVNTTRQEMSHADFEERQNHH